MASDGLIYGSDGSVIGEKTMSDREFFAPLLGGYDCPSCGSAEPPAVKVACAERITYYTCACGFSTWDAAEFERSR